MSSPFTITIEEVNLEKANAFLATIDENRMRKVRKRTVETYARDMLAGNWFLNGSTVGVNELGRMVDGVHRMRAMKLAGEQGAGKFPAQPDIKIYFAVVRGIKADQSVEDTIDTGNARLYRDVLGIRGYSNTTLVASTTRRYLAWTNGSYYNANPGGHAYSFSELDDFFNKHSENIEKAVAYGSLNYQRAQLTPTSLALSKLVLDEIDPDQADEFLAGLISGANLLRTSPIWMLRRRYDMIDHNDWTARNSATVQARKLAMLMSAWNHFRDDKPAGNLPLPKGGLTNKNFPRPH